MPVQNGRDDLLLLQLLPAQFSNGLYHVWTSEVTRQADGKGRGLFAALSARGRLTRVEYEDLRLRHRPRVEAPSPDKSHYEANVNIGSAPILLSDYGVSQGLAFDDGSSYATLIQ